MPPKGEPIVSETPVTGAGRPARGARPASGRVVAERTDEPIAARFPEDELDAMRRKKEAEAQLETETTAKAHVAEQTEEALPLASGIPSAVRRQVPSPPAAPRKPPDVARPAKPSVPQARTRERPPQGGVVTLAEAKAVAKEQQQFETLLGRLRQQKLAFRYERGAHRPKPEPTTECDPALIDHVRRARATEALQVGRKGDPFPLDSFETNFAAFRVTIDGKQEIIVARNTEQSLHSEEWIVQRLEHAVGPLHVPANRARVTIDQVFTERAPCAGRCESVLAKYFPEAKVFFWVAKAGERPRWAAGTLHEFWRGLKPLANVD
jgi:hypothetical protein